MYLKHVYDLQQIIVVHKLVSYTLRKIYDLLSNADLVFAEINIDQEKKIKDPVGLDLIGQFEINAMLIINSVQHKINQNEKRFLFFTADIDCMHLKINNALKETPITISEWNEISKKYIISQREQLLQQLLHI